MLKGCLQILVIGSVLLLGACVQDTVSQSGPVPTARNNITAINPDTYEYAFQEFYNRAKQGDSVAQNNLGRMYTDGRGVEQDSAEAVKWFSKAAIQGNPSAMVNLGMACLHGRGTPENKKQACKYFWKANMLGSREASRFYKSYC